MQRNKLKISKMQIATAMFKQKEFDFIVKYQGKEHKKQREALEILSDNETESFLYGGAAGGAKSWTGAAWLIFMCLMYSGTKYFIGRDELKKIKQSTLSTFFKVAKAYGIKGYKYNAQDSYILFDNGSKIDLLELKYLPRDPMFERFGSIEYTCGWIEEAGEVNYQAFEILNTRVGREKNKEYSIRAKIFITCNPKKNWLYREFYQPSIKGELEEGKRFLQALVQDNPFIDEHYIQRLDKLKDKATRERLKNGNWDYVDNPYALCNYTNILAIWKNGHIIKKDVYYITADIARFGSDSARIGVWKDWDLVEIISFKVSATTEIQAAIQALRVKYQIPAHHCIADEDGVGGGVVDNCGIKGFLNGSKPYKEKVSDGTKEVPKYKNLQTQCLFGLAEKINTNQIYISAEVSESDKEQINQELSTIERDASNTEKLAVTSKAKIKEDIGHSPDWRDMMLMRKAFDYLEAQNNYLTFG